MDCVGLRCLLATCLLSGLACGRSDLALVPLNDETTGDGGGTSQDGNTSGGATSGFPDTDEGADEATDAGDASADASGTAGESGGESGEAICGNAMVEFPEECDDGNLDSTDGCFRDCLAAVEVTGATELEGYFDRMRGIDTAPFGIVSVGGVVTGPHALPVANRFGTGLELAWTWAGAPLGDTSSYQSAFAISSTRAYMGTRVPFSQGGVSECCDEWMRAIDVADGSLAWEAQDPFGAFAWNDVAPFGADTVLKVGGEWVRRVAPTGAQAWSAPAQGGTLVVDSLDDEFLWLVKGSEIHAYDVNGALTSSQEIPGATASARHSFVRRSDEMSFVLLDPIDGYFVAALRGGVWSNEQLPEWVGESTLRASYSTIDGNLVLCGSAEGRPFAQAIDLEGNVQWRYWPTSPGTCAAVADNATSRIYVADAATDQGLVMAYRLVEIAG